MYRLCVLEKHIGEDEDLDIRESAIMLLSNIAAEDSLESIKAILSKGKLFKILQENIELKNITPNILENIVNLITNLSRDWIPFTFSDFSDLPDLISEIFPLVINFDVVNTTLMNSFK